MAWSLPYASLARLLIRLFAATFLHFVTSHGYRYVEGRPE